MRFFGTINILDFDAEGYTQQLRKAIEVQMRQAARAFLRAAIPLVPVQTGMARGSYLNIGRFLRVAVPIAPVLFNKRYYPPSIWSHNRAPGRRRVAGTLPKTPETGASLTTQPENIIRFEKNRFIFELQTSVFHYTLEDFIGVKSPSAPWGSFQAGQQAFLSVMSQLNSRVPSIASFTTRTTVTFGRGQPVRSGPIRIRRQETVGD